MTREQWVVTAAISEWLDSAWWVVAVTGSREAAEELAGACQRWHQWREAVQDSLDFWASAQDLSPCPDRAMPAHEQRRAVYSVERVTEGAPGVYLAGVSS